MTRLADLLADVDRAGQAHFLKPVCLVPNGRAHLGHVAGPLLLWIESRYPRSTSEAAGRAVRAGATAEGAVASRPRSSGRVAAN